VFRLTILKLSGFALAMSDHKEVHSLLSPELGGQHFEINNSDDLDESDELISFSNDELFRQSFVSGLMKDIYSNEKTDACSTSEGADPEQQKAYEAQKLEEEICQRLQICAKRHSFLEILTDAVSYLNSIDLRRFWINSLLRLWNCQLSNAMLPNEAPF
jgi:hypothetical protein